MSFLKLLSEEYQRMWGIWWTQWQSTGTGCIPRTYHCRVSIMLL